MTRSRFKPRVGQNAGQAVRRLIHGTYIELRGVGIINARRIFGMGAVKMTEKIDMVVQLEPWDNGKVYDRLGLR